MAAAVGGWGGQHGNSGVAASGGGEPPRRPNNDGGPKDHRGTPILGPKRKKILRGARGNAARCTPSFARRANKRSKTRMSTAQTEPHPAAPLPVPIIQQWQAPIIPQWQAPTFPPGVVTVDNNTLVSHDYFVRGVIGGLQELHQYVTRLELRQDAMEQRQRDESAATLAALRAITQRLENMTNSSGSSGPRQHPVVDLEQDDLADDDDSPFPPEQLARVTRARKGIREALGSTSARKQKRKRNPMPTFTPGYEEQMGKEEKTER
ncbi:hypothetical protein F5883DRAFT_714284 [Diaporthe sp. PMI_573]|nr:hypothetical protein F5883DRAFT_714284 [Diaporthaceae sp. PMI_573]